MSNGQEKEKDLKKGGKRPPATEKEDPAVVTEEAPGQDYREDSVTGGFGKEDPSQGEGVEEAHDARETTVEDSGTDPEKQALLEEKENLLAKLQRARADFDNYRRISRAEQEEARERGLCDFLCRLLPVIDNLERALQSARDEEVPASHVEGLELIQGQLAGLLEQEGAVVMEAKGMPFDPNFHHAVLQAEEEDGSEPGIVLEELQQGYLYKKKVLRPAMVKVSRC